MKYADLIRAALDGEKLQFRCRANQEMPWGPWLHCSDMRLTVANMAAEYTTMDYRLTPPPPPPDMVKYRHCYDPDITCDFHVDPRLMRRPYEKVTWDGATGEVKSIELIK